MVQHKQIGLKGFLFFFFFFFFIYFICKSLQRYDWNGCKSDINTDTQKVETKENKRKEKKSKWKCHSVKLSAYAYVLGGGDVFFFSYFCCCFSLFHFILFLRIYIHFNGRKIRASCNLLILHINTIDIFYIKCLR